jgi:hypothetical protein
MVQYLESAGSGALAGSPGLFMYGAIRTVVTPPADMLALSVWGKQGYLTWLKTRCPRFKVGLFLYYLN